MGYDFRNLTLLKPPVEARDTHSYTGEIVDLFARPEWNGWGVLTVDVGHGHVKGTGTVGHLSPGVGMEVTLGGAWEPHDKYGWNFKIKVASPVEPTSPEAFAGWLVGSVKGLGLELARRIAHQFPPEAFWEAVEENPKRLREVRDVGPKLIERLTALRHKRAEQQQMTRLLAMGLEPWLIERVIETWGSSSADVVQGNPYNILELDGVGWGAAEKVAAALGIEYDDERRVAAALFSTIADHERETGDTFMTYGSLCSFAEIKLGAAASLANGYMLAVDAGALIEEGARIYRGPMHKAERDLMGRTCTLAGDAAQDGYDTFEDIGTLSEDQQDAVGLAMAAETSIITGGPGTGKTTTIRALLSSYAEPGEVLLLAPTGKAAKRMHEVTGCPAATIHRGLGYNPRSGWEFNEDCRHPAQLVIVDEFSMVDQALAGHLVRGISPDAQLIMVGDADQLPPVGPGSVFRDFIESGSVPVARLTQVHRAAADSWVAKAAHRIMRGEDLDLSAAPDFGFIAEPSVDTVYRGVEAAVEYCLANHETMPQILSPQRKGAAGIWLLNDKLQARYNPRTGREMAFKIGDREWVLRSGDVVMQTKNDYTKGVFNGDVGRIVYVGEKSVGVTFNDEDGIGDAIEYTKRQARQLDLAYATTIHKSQGSEYPWVVLVAHPAHRRMLTRELFYTGITRAQKGVILVGDHGAVARATACPAPRRNTTLVARLRGELEV